jgi:chromosome segregation ATPase
VNGALLVAVIALGVGLVGLGLAIAVNRRSETAVRAVDGRLDNLRDNVDDQTADLSQRVDRLLGTQRDLSVRVTDLIDELKAQRDEVSRLAGDQESQAVDILASFARLEQCETRLSKLTAVVADAADAGARLADESKADRARLETEMGDLLFRQSDLLRAEIVADVAQRTVKTSPRGGANTKG